jgi:hypothetical protein
MELNFLKEPTVDTTLAQLLNIPEDRKQVIFDQLDELTHSDSNFTERLQQIAEMAQTPEELLFITTTHLTIMFDKGLVHVSYDAYGGR